MKRMKSSQSLNHTCLNNIPRLLNLLDQNPFSTTCGCFDRDFWHYKIAKDFPSSIYQQGVLSLALIYKYKFKNNPYYKNEKIKKLILAAISYWQKIQNQDGTFSEWYPDERSYVATSFTSFAISETLVLLKKEIKQKIQNKIVCSLEKSAQYLINTDDPFVANHTASDLPFFYNLYLLTNKQKYLTKINKKLKELTLMQNSEGWFKEYTGPDLGYQTLTIYYLAKYYQKSKNKKVKKMLNSALDFTSYFLHPDGSFGGEYGSRNTNYFLPAGFAILSKSSPVATSIFSWWQENHPKNLPSVSDDRYFCFFFLPNYLETLNQNAISSKKFEIRNFHKNFKNANILVTKTKKYYAVISYNKNGIIKIFQLKPKPKLIFSDVGYFGKLKNGKLITTQFINPNPDIKLKLSKDLTEIRLKTRLAFISIPINTPFKFFILRGFNSSLGKIGLFSNLFSNFLKKTKILKTKFSQTLLVRKITIKEDEVVINDNIYPRNNFSLFGILTHGSLLFVPSSKISPKTDITPIISNNLTEKINNGKLNLSRQINLSSSKPKITSSESRNLC